MNAFQLTLFAPTMIERRAEIPAGLVFDYAGRGLRVH